jgi:hypothetical protein
MALDTRWLVTRSRPSEGEGEKGDALRDGISTLDHFERSACQVGASLAIDRCQSGTHDKRRIILIEWEM